jgi:hypothetical protein
MAMFLMKTCVALRVTVCPLWAKSGHHNPFAERPKHPAKIKDGRSLTDAAFVIEEVYDLGQAVLT